MSKIRMGPELSPGVRTALLRREDGDSPVLMTRPKDGAPIPPGASMVHVDQECREGWHDVTTLYTNGPAQVATPEYREGWERIFGGKQPVGDA